MSQQFTRIEDWFWAQVARGAPNQCWEWQGRRDGFNYGYVFIAGKKVRAHRRAYLLTHGGTIPARQVVRHTCNNPGCVNPGHLRLKTRSQVARELIKSGRSVLRPYSEVWKHRHPNALDEEQRQAIRHSYAGGQTIKDLAQRFGIHYSTVSRIVHGRTPRGVKSKRAKKPVKARLLANRK